MSMSDLHAEGVKDLDSYNLGVIAERQRIIGLLDAHYGEALAVAPSTFMSAYINALVALGDLIEGRA